MEVGRSGLPQVLAFPGGEILGWPTAAASLITSGHSHSFSELFGRWNFLVGLTIGKTRQLRKGDKERKMAIFLNTAIFYK